MKKLLLSTFVACLALTANAQYYDFSVSSGTYTEISGITVSGADWDDETYWIKPSYDIAMFGQVIDSFSFNDYVFEFYKDGSIIGTMAACAGDLASLGGTESPVRWVESGSAPNRILKIEFANAGMFNDQGGTQSDTLNFQVWFHENDTVEVHFGESIVAQDGDDPWDGADGPIVGTYNPMQRGIFMSGDSSAPTVNLVDNTTTEEYSIMGMPSSGTIYVFSPRMNQVTVPTVVDTKTVTVYPNPFNNQLTINTEVEMDITLSDAQGKVISTFTVNGDYTLNTSELSNGIYFIRSSNGSVVKLVK